MDNNNDSGKRKITTKLNCLKKHQTLCDNVCLLCQQPANEFNDVHCGHLYKLGKFALHYLCVLTASTLAQKTELKKEFFGFCYLDIIDVYKKSLKIVCERCKTAGATIKCFGCEKSYHLLCSIRSEMVIHMQGSYPAYCYSCKRPKPISSTLFQDKSCIICFEKVETDDKALRPSCCRAEELFHVYCLKKLAMNAGHQFKCPLCQNIGSFRKTARSHGVFIPNYPPVWIKETIIEPQPVSRELIKAFTREHSGSLNPRSSNPRSSNPRSSSSSNQLSPCASSSSSNTSRHTRNVSSGRGNDHDHSDASISSDNNLDVSSDIDENPPITQEELRAMADQLQAKYPPGFARIFVIKAFTREHSGSLNPTSSSSSNQLSPCASSSSSNTSRYTRNVSSGRGNDHDHSDASISSDNNLDVSSDIDENPPITQEELRAMADQLQAKYPPGFARIFVGERMLCVRYRGDPLEFERAQDNA